MRRAATATCPPPADGRSARGHRRRRRGRRAFGSPPVYPRSLGRSPVVTDRTRGVDTRVLSVVVVVHVVVAVVVAPCVYYNNNNIIIV